MTLTFRVDGVPAPGGSKRYVGKSKAGRAILVDAAGDRNKSWKEAVKAAVRDQYDGPVLFAAIEVRMTFLMPRPKGHYGSGKNAGRLKPNAPKYHTVKPDALKLARSTEDAMTGLVYRDDAATARLVTEKVYADRPGAEIQVNILDDPLSQ